MRGKCFKCETPGHYAADCPARIIPAPSQIAKASDSNGERVFSIAVGLVSSKVDDCNDFGYEGGLEKWRADSAATFHMTGSKELMYDIRPSNDKVRIGDATVLDVECVGTVNLVFPGENGIEKVTIEDVAYVPALRFNLFSLVIAHQKMYLKPEEDEITLSFLDGRLKLNLMVHHTSR